MVNVTAGSGSGYGFVGQVYLTGPYGGAPFGMSVVVPAVAGPFNLGNVVTRGTINVEPYTARVVATSNLPTIVKGIPLRIRRHHDQINRQGFLQNPTNCGVFATETTLTGIDAGREHPHPLSTPFQVNNAARWRSSPLRRVHRGEDLESQRRQPGNDDRRARGQGQRQSGRRAVAQAAALAADDTAESVPRSHVRRQPDTCPSGARSWAA